MNNISTHSTPINTAFQEKLNSIQHRIEQPSSQEYLEQIVLDHFNYGKEIPLTLLVRQFLEEDSIKFQDNTFFADELFCEKYGTKFILPELIKTVNNKIISTLTHTIEGISNKKFRATSAKNIQDTKEQYIRLIPEEDYILEQLIKQGKILKIEYKDITIICDHNKGSVYDIVFGE